MTSDFKINGNVFQSSEILNKFEKEETDTQNTSSSNDIKNLVNSTSEDNLLELDESGFEYNNQGYLEYTLKMQELRSLKNEKLALIEEEARLKREKEQLRYNLINAQDEDEKSSITQKMNDLNSEIESVGNSIEECNDEISSLNTEIMEGISGISSGSNDLTTGTTQSSWTGSIATETIDSSLANALDQKLGTGFAAKVEEVAKNLNCNPNDLLAMMYSESGINPNIRGFNGAAGLIQFMPSILPAYGYTADQVASMSGVQQLDLVQEVLSKSKEMSGYSASDKIDAGTLYAICFLPASAKNDVLCSSTGNLSWAYSANSPLDIDGDGSITKSDMAARLSKKYEEMRQAFA